MEITKEVKANIYDIATNCRFFSGRNENVLVTRTVENTPFVATYKKRLSDDSLFGDWEAIFLIKDGKIFEYDEYDKVFVHQKDISNQYHSPKFEALPIKEAEHYKWLLSTHGALRF